MQKLWCLSFNLFRKHALQHNWNIKVPDDVAVISINNGKGTGSFEEYHVCESADNVLNLDFDDVDPAAFNLHDETETHSYKSSYDGHLITLQFFTEEMSRKSIEFIERNIDKNFYIHCSAGVSRSQAFVSFIKSMYIDREWETNPDNPCEFPNGFVKSKLNHTYLNLFDS